MGTRALVLTSTWQGNGELVVELATRDLPEPTGRQVLVRVEAAPINPSDLGVLFGRADLARARFEPGRIVARMIDEAAPPTFAKRVDLPIGCGNEGAGTVIAAGEAPEAQALLGRTVSGMGQMYASHRLIDAGACIPLPEGMAAEAGAAAFVNPMTALAFVETMRAEGCEALLHTAAASNLGQMLVRVCAEDGVPLINVVRSPAQAELLRGMGARWVLDSTAPGYFDDLVAAIRETGLPLAFDAIRLAGAAYLMWMGVRMLLSKPAADGGSSAALVAAQAAPVHHAPLRKVFLGGFWTNVLNPKVAIFFLAFVPQFIAPGADNKALAFVLLGVLFNLNAIPVNVGWALAASWMARRAGVIQRGMHWLDRVAGAMFIGFGLKLAFTDQPSA